MKNLTTTLEAVVMQEQYRDKCTFRRRGALIERRTDTGWAKVAEHKTINGAKRSCHGGTYKGAPVYSV